LSATAWSYGCLAELHGIHRFLTTNRHEWTRKISDLETTENTDYTDFLTTKHTKITKIASPQEPTISKRLVFQNKNPNENESNGFLRLGGCHAAARSYGCFAV
jgi:hypothetical protein